MDYEYYDCRTGKEYLRNGGAGTSMPAMMHALQPRNLTTYRYEKKKEGLRRKGPTG